MTDFPRAGPQANLSDSGQVPVPSKPPAPIIIFKYNMDALSSPRWLLDKWAFAR